MFIVNEVTKQIDMHRGDTGGIRIKFRGRDLREMDAWALFTLKNARTEVKIVFQQIVDNRIDIMFSNADTDNVEPGTYEYDVRVIVNPTLDDEGMPINGEDVKTVQDPIPVTIRRTVGIV